MDNSELQQERDGWRYRASFWKGAAELAASRNVVERLEARSEAEVMQSILRTYIYSGLENGLFGSDQVQPPTGPVDDLFEGGSPETIPWSVVVESAAAFDVDAEEALHDFVEHAQENLRLGLNILGVDLRGMEQYMMEPRFAGIPITPQMANEIMRGTFGPDFAEAFADKYIANVMHGDKPCKHPYDSLDEAIEGLAFDLERGVISSVSEITHKGEQVMGEEYLMRRINDIGSASLN